MGKGGLDGRWQSTASKACVKVAPWEANEAVEGVEVVEPQQECLIITLITLPGKDYSIPCLPGKRTIFCLFVDRVLEEIVDVSVEILSGFINYVIEKKTRFVMTFEPPCTVRPPWRAVLLFW